MEYQISREVFFNLGGPHGIARFVVYGVALIVTAIFIYLLVQKIRVWRLGQPEVRTDKLGKRIWGVIQYVFLQAKLLKEVVPGLTHFLLFWGFLVLFIGTALIVIQEDFTLLIFDVRFWYGNFYKFYSVALDLFGLGAIVAIIVFGVIRYIQRPDRLDNRPTDLISLVLILLILISGFFNEGLRLAATEVSTNEEVREMSVVLSGADEEFLREFPELTDEELIEVANESDLFIGTTFDEENIYVLRNAYYYNPELARWSPVGLVLANLFNSKMTESSILSFHRINWWIHLALAMSFVVYLFLGKLLHIVTSTLNVFFRKLEPRASLIPIEDMENAETFGVYYPEQFTWKQLLDGDACTRCGRCQDNCPAYLSDKPLSPKDIVIDTNDNIYERAPALFSKTASEEIKSKALIGEANDIDAIWACTTCLACVEACPVLIDQPQKIIDMRRYKVLMEGEMSPELTTSMRNMENNSNPYGFGFHERGNWAEGLPVKTLAEDPDVEYLYYVGCAGSFDDRYKKVASTFVKIMEKAGVKIGILGQEEGCCGDSARRAGNEYLYSMLALQNIETINNYKIKKIVTTCPHGYNCLKNEYPQNEGGKFEVYHFTELVLDLIRQGRIKLEKKVDGIEKVAYHDSCFLGRYNGLYDQPRKILGSIPGVSVDEFTRNKAKSYCCGAGGARMWMEETIGKRINHVRTQDAIDKGYGTIGTACPFCLTMLSDGIKELEKEESMKAFDILELVAKSMGIE
jgi:Fe-S oxidoreductase/nitrate reductase gamma subunit